MFSRLRRFVSFSILAALVLSLGSCSKDPDSVVPPDAPIPTTVADDIATMFGAMAASDNGGWFLGIESSFNATPRTGSALLRAGRPMPFGTGPGSPRDTTFTRAEMNWTMDYTFFDTLDVASAVYETTTVRAQVLCDATGTISLGSAGSTPIVYVHRDTMDVDDMPDSLVTYGAISQVDSAFWTLGTGTQRYYLVDNLIEYTAHMSQQPVVAYPVDGEAIIDGFVDQLRSPNRADGIATYDVSFTITFDGTQTPIATLGPNTDTPDPALIRRYRIDLKTGAVVALP